jgi:adenylate cyclase class IV
MSRDNCRNIEIKAKLADEAEFKEKVEIAKSLTGKNEAEVLKQHDVFFKSTQGRLKLRYENGRAPKLIQYDRDNVHGPKLSKFDILEFNSKSEGELLEKMLDASIGKRNFHNFAVKLCKLAICRYLGSSR